MENISAYWNLHCLIVVPAGARVLLLYYSMIDSHIFVENIYNVRISFLIYFVLHPILKVFTVKNGSIWIKSPFVLLLNKSIYHEICIWLSPSKHAKWSIMSVRHKAALVNSASSDLQVDSFCVPFPLLGGRTECPKRDQRCETLRFQCREPSLL